MAQFDSNKFLTSSSSLQKFRNNSNSLGRMPSLVNTMDNMNGGQMKIQGVNILDENTISHNKLMRQEPSDIIIESGRHLSKDSSLYKLKNNTSQNILAASSGILQQQRNSRHESYGGNSQKLTSWINQYSNGGGTVRDRSLPISQHMA